VPPTSGLAEKGGRRREFDGNVQARPRSQPTRTARYPETDALGWPPTLVSTGSTS